MSSEKEQALLDRIDAELEASLDVSPSPAFLPAARRRVAELRAPRETAARWWLAPVLATLAAILFGAHLIEDATRRPGTVVSPPHRTVQDEKAIERPVAEAPAPAAEAPTRVVDAAPESGPDPVRLAPPAVPSLPRVIVPPEDEQAVRRLARRLRGHAARAAALAPEVEGPFDVALEPAEDGWETVSLDQGLVPRVEPGLDEPLSFDRTIENAGRET